MTTRTLIPALDRMLTLDRELDRVLGRVASRNGTSALVPPMDVVETETSYVIMVELPGIEPSQVDLTVEQNVLTLRGTRPALEDASAQRVHLQERPSGAFARALRLPGQIDADRISATHAQGVLTVTVPKAVQAMARKIAID